MPDILLPPMYTFLILLPLYLGRRRSAPVFFLLLIYPHIDFIISITGKATYVAVAAYDQVPILVINCLLLINN